MKKQVKKAIFSLSLATSLLIGFTADADAATKLKESSKNIVVNGSSITGKGLSQIWDFDGTIKSVGATSHLNASSAYIKVETGVDANTQTRTASSATGAVSLTTSLGTKDTSSNYHIYSTHKIYINGNLAATANTSTNW